MLVLKLSENRVLTLAQNMSRNKDRIDCDQRFECNISLVESQVRLPCTIWGSHARHNQFSSHRRAFEIRLSVISHLIFDLPLTGVGFCSKRAICPICNYWNSPSIGSISQAITVQCTATKLPKPKVDRNDSSMFLDFQSNPCCIRMVEMGFPLSFNS